MKVLMFGWEFPPKIYGGLAVASYGITKGLSLQGDIQTTFCMPRPTGDEEDFLKIINMSQKERTAYFNHPIRCNHDYLTFIRRNMPARYPLSWLFRMMLTYYPKLYFRINGARGI